MDCIVIDDLPPEVVAMLQALYSRSPQSVRAHLAKMKNDGHEKFMSRYYVGYGHKSIGDCGTTSVFIENVSMLVAKAVQDNPLYSGQEASTRYLDMATQPLIDPVSTTESAAIQNTWMNLYKAVLAALIPHFEQRFPREGGQKESIWRKAVKARAFDVARGLLPAGCATYVAWHTNLRQAHDHLKLMHHNPCAEVRAVASRIAEELLTNYPSSFGHKTYNEQELYLADSVGTFAFNAEAPDHQFSADFTLLDQEGLKKHQRLLETRPPKTELHQRFRQYGLIRFAFPLDFGSYRDLQRQRSCVQEMPLLTTNYGFFPWYIEQLPESWQKVVRDVCATQEEAIANLDTSDAEKQYYVAMGYTCPVRIACPLPSAIYIAELRSGSTVHPTLRVPAQRMGDVLQETIPGLAMHHDKSEGVWDIKRGTQDIIEHAL